MLLVLLLPMFSFFSFCFIEASLLPCILTKVSEKHRATVFVFLIFVQILNLWVLLLSNQTEFNSKILHVFWDKRTFWARIVNFHPNYRVPLYTSLGCWITFKLAAALPTVLVPVHRQRVAGGVPHCRVYAGPRILMNTFFSCSITNQSRAASVPMSLSNHSISMWWLSDSHAKYTAQRC